MVFFGCAITLYGVFAIPTNMGKTAQYAWFFICYTLLNAVFYTANNIAYAALTSLVTKNSKERVQMGFFPFHVFLWYKPCNSVYYCRSS